MLYVILVDHSKEPPVVLRNPNFPSATQDWHMTSEQARAVARALIEAADYAEAKGFRQEIA